MRQLKIVPVLILAIVLALSSTSSAGDHNRNISLFDGQLYSSDDIIIDLDDGSVIITHDYEDGEIEITEDYELYVDGDLIKTNAKQQKMLKEYHTLVYDIKDYAIDIGKEGAKIGIEGAKIGLQAIGGVIKMIFTEYDEDDLDEDMERATAKIETKAEALEDRAEEIEDMADELDDLFYDLAEEIPAISKLDW